MDEVRTRIEPRWEKYAGLGGVVFGVLVLVLLFLDSTPADDATAGDWLAYLTEDTGTKTVYVFLMGIALVAFLWCFGSVRSILARAEGDVNRLSSLAFGGAVLTVGFLGVSSALAWSMAITEQYLSAFDGEAQTGLALIGAGATVFVYAAMAAGFAVAAAGIAMLRGRVFPRWFAWVSVISGVLIFTGGLLDFTFLFLPLWAVVAGALVMGGIRTEAPEPLRGETQRTMEKTGSS